MLPIQPLLDRPDGLFRNFQAAPDLSATQTGREKGDRLLCLRLGKFRRVDSVPATGVPVAPHPLLIAEGCAATIVFVAHVMAVGAGIKVFVSNAGRIVAVMASQTVGWVKASLNREGHSLGTVGAAPELHAAVAVLISSELPLPAVSVRALTGRLIDVRPKASYLLRGKGGKFKMRLSHINPPTIGIGQSRRGVTSTAATRSL